MKCFFGIVFVLFFSGVAGHADEWSAYAGHGNGYYRCDYWSTMNGQLFTSMGCDLGPLKDLANKACLRTLRPGYECVSLGCKPWGAGGRCN